MIKMTKTCLCPRDGAALELGFIFDVEMLMCPQCQGLFVKQAEINSLLANISKGLLQSVPIDTLLEAAPDRGGDLECPVCSSTMEHFGYMAAHSVMLDACHECRMVWVDASELTSMALQHAQASQRIDAIRADEESAREASNRSLHSLNTARMAAASWTRLFRTREEI